MTYANYKDVVEFLNIQFLQVIVKLDTEYQNFKKLDIIENCSKIFGDIDELIDGEDPEHFKGSNVSFWIDVNNYLLDSYQVLENNEGVVGSTLIDSRNIVKNQIVIDFDTFVQLIS